MLFRSEKSPPIIALTANAYKGSKEEYYEAGMDGYVSKPIAELKLAYQIKELLGDVIKLKSIPKGKTNFEDLDSVITEQECNIRLDSLNKLVNHDPQKINMFLGLFIKSVKEDIQIMETLFDNKEFNLINSKAHKVKPEIDLLCNEFNKNLVREIEDKEKKLTEVELKEKVEIFVEQMNKYKEDAQRLMEEFVS